MVAAPVACSAGFAQSAAFCAKVDDSNGSFTEATATATEPMLEIFFTEHGVGVPTTFSWWGYLAINLTTGQVTKAILDRKGPFVCTKSTINALLDFDWQSERPAEGGQ